MILNSPYISGSLTVTGNTTIQGQLTVTGSLSGTASLASNALLLQGTGSTGFATTSSLLEVSSSQQQISSSQQQISASLLNVIAIGATTGSNSFRADQSITGSLVVSSTITAQTLVVQTVTSSIVYSSGSNIFGSALGDRQTFTGSVNITGSSFNANVNTAYFNSSITASNALLRSADSAAVVDIFTLYNPSSTSSGVRQKYQNGYGDLAAIKVSQRDNSTLADDGQIEFQVASNSVLDTKLTILNTGVATFSGNVNVYDGSSRGLTISNSSGAITFSNNWGKTTFTAPSAQDIEFNDDAGTKRLFLKNGGNVGIGTCIAAAKLEIEAGRNCTLLRLTATSGENWDFKNCNAVGSTDVLSIGAAGATANLNLVDNGNILIGTPTDNTKGAKVQITQGTNNTNAIDFKNSDVTSAHIGTFANNMYLTQNYYYAGGQYNDCSAYGQAAITMGVGTSAGTTSIDFAMSDPGATFPSSKMRIMSNGSVAIGTTCFYNGANFVVSAGSGTASSPYMGIFNCTASPTNDASVRLDLGFLGGASNYVATGGCLGFINFMGQGNDAGYGGASIITVTACGGNTCRFNHAIDMVFTAKPTGQTGALERMRITSGGTIFNRQWFGATLIGGYSLIGTIGPGNVGNRYLHARINTIGSMMVWIKIFGYSYAGGILEGIGGGYVDGGTGTIAQNFNNGSIPIIHQNAGYIEVVVDTVGTGTTNRWGSITFLGGTDTIATVQPLEIMTWSWTSTTTRVY
jgi:hypothetical protein